MATATLPTGRAGSPRPVRRFQLTPPSPEIKRPLPGPPLSLPQVWISSCHMPAKRIRGLFASMARSEQPVFSSTKSALSQVLPPSVVRKTPRSCCGPLACPSAHAQTTFGSRGSMTMRPIRPVFSRPMEAQVFPASVDLYIPLPIEIWLRIKVSPVPAQITFGSEGATASAPIEETG